MTRFVVSDHHFNHENIIEYCNRPFDSVDEMNQHMIERWNSVVSEDDVIIHIGDVAFTGGGSDSPSEILENLNGQKMVIAGNHDESINPDEFPYPVVESTVIQYHGYRFWCTHRPEDVPDEWTEWLIHGHVHNDQPFIEYQNNKINVSVERTKYTPLPLSQLVKGLKSMRGSNIADTIEDSPIKNHQWYQQNVE